MNHQKLGCRSWISKFLLKICYYASKETQTKNTKHIYCCHLDKKRYFKPSWWDQGNKKENLKNTFISQSWSERNQMALLNTWYFISHKWFRHLQVKYQKKKKMHLTKSFSCKSIVYMLGIGCFLHQSHQQIRVVLALTRFI